MSEITAYRIVGIKNRFPHCLFHGLPGENGRRSRLLPINTWIKAEQKLVVDGGKQEPYLSGFNVLLHEWECDHYLTRFTAPRNLRVVKIKVRGKLKREVGIPYGGLGSVLPGRRGASCSFHNGR